MKIARGTIHGFAVFSAGVLLLMMVLTFWNVILRVTGMPLLSALVEISALLLVCSMASLAETALQDRNISVDVLVNTFPLKVRFSLNMVMLTLCLLYFVVLGTRTLMTVEVSQRLKVFYSVLRIPEWPFIIILGICFLACAVAVGLLIIKTIKNRNVDDIKDKTDISTNPEVAILALMNAEGAVLSYLEEENNKPEQSKEEVED